MKRNQNLRKLSSDHHQSLGLSRKITRVIENGEDASQLPALVRDTYDKELKQHFLLEENTLLPELEKAGEHALVRRTLDEHIELRRLVEQIDQPENLLAFSRLLKAHVRFEEQELFEVSQNRLDSATLDTIGQRCEHAHRPG